MSGNPPFRRWLRRKRIAFDSSFLIPLLEDRNKEPQPISRVFQMIERKRIVCLTSTITLLEILVHPYRQEDLDAVNRYYGYLTRSSLIQLIPVTSEIADRAAEFRARYGLKTPDAIQLATASEAEAGLFLTRDRDFLKQKEVDVGIL